jgi:HSP20 family protein
MSDLGRDPFVALQDEMNRLFNDAFRGVGGTPGIAGNWPSVDVSDKDDKIEVVAELPGMKEDDVEVMLDENVLTLRGERRDEREDEDNRFSERFYGRFERRIPLPHDIDEDNVKADFDKGELTISLPKTEKAKSGGKRIEISSS